MGPLTNLSRTLWASCFFLVVSVPLMSGGSTGGCFLGVRLGDARLEVLDKYARLKKGRLGDAGPAPKKSSEMLMAFSKAAHGPSRGSLL